MYKLKYEEVIDYRRANRLLKWSILLCLLLIFAGEILVWYTNVRAGVFSDARESFVKRVLAPTTINFAIYGFIIFMAAWGLKHKRPYIQAMSTVLGTSILCFSLINIHYTTPAIYAVLVFPMLLALQFVDKRPLAFAYVFNTLAYLLFACLILPGKPDAQMAAQGTTEIITTVSLLTAAYVGAVYLLHTLGHLVQNIIQKEKLIQMDQFTKLYNHTVFYKRLDELILDNHRQGMVFSVILYDIDDFKSINDSYGHSTGDSVLLAFAKAMKRCVGQDGYCFRYGGDEFAVLYFGDERQARYTAERIKDGFAQLLMPLHLPRSVTVSAGICEYNRAHQNGSRDFFSAADYVLYEAKRQTGKDAIIVWSPEEGWGQLTRQA